MGSSLVVADINTWPSWFLVATAPGAGVVTTIVPNGMHRSWWRQPMILTQSAAITVIPGTSSDEGRFVVFLKSSCIFAKAVAYTECVTTEGDDVSCKIVHMMLPIYAQPCSAVELMALSPSCMQST